ncbi:MAG TPA: DUF1801 domain-containing protein [Vicinamibacterales bacterium]|nr:DUF1801 domain-containing protein [Vicinamibacterales bacterium]
MAKTTFKSVNEYIASQPKGVRVILERVRGAIRRAVPAAQETLSYQMPVYMLDGVPVLYFAAWKHHYSLYPASEDLVAAFRDELAGYQRTKATIGFPLSEPVPVQLIERIARFRADQLTKRDRGKGARTTGRRAQLERVRRFCAALPGISEKLSHGAPSFFVEKDKGVFAMFVDNHHDDGHLAVWLPVAEGLQSAMIEEEPATYFKPPYVGTSGWIGIELARIRDDALEIHLREAWQLVARKMKKSRTRAAGERWRRPARTGG